MKQKKRFFGTYDIAKICHVMPATIGRWIEEGKLPSFTTGGGHRRVWSSDLETFLQAHNIPVPPEVASSARECVLIVDDDAVVRATIVRTLSKFLPTLQLHEATDGFEAGYKAGTLSPSLVILDLRLPGMDGLRVCQMLRENTALKDLKILGVTGFGADATKKKFLDAGANDFLGKPFSPQELIEKTAALLSLGMKKN